MVAEARASALKVIIEATAKVTMPMTHMREPHLFSLSPCSFCLDSASACKFCPMFMKTLPRTWTAMPMKTHKEDPHPEAQSWP